MRITTKESGSRGHSITLIADKAIIEECSQSFNPETQFRTDLVIHEVRPLYVSSVGCGFPWDGPCRRMSHSQLFYLISQPSCPGVVVRGRIRCSSHTKKQLEERRLSISKCQRCAWTFEVQYSLSIYVLSLCMLFIQPSNSLPHLSPNPIS